MSALKPILRELREAVLKGFGHAKHKLHQLADNMDDHLDNVVKQVRDADKFDAPGGNGGSSRPSGDSDALVARPECLNADGQVDWSQAPHGGFRLDEDGKPMMQDHVPAAGDVFDRYGGPDGRYVSPVPESGSFSFESRSLPYVENPNAYHRYEWAHSPADVESVYSSLDDATRADVDAVLNQYDLDVSDLAHVARGDAAPIPAWGTPGGATQDLLPVSVELLDIMGMIREVD